MNNIILIGRLTKEVELRYTESEKAIGNFTIAVNRDYKNQNGEYETDFFNCVVFGKQAETIQQYTKKGDLVGLRGKLQNRSYEDKEGNKRYATEIVVEKITFLQTNKKEKTKVEDNPYKDMSVKVEADQSVEISDSDLPF